MTRRLALVASATLAVLCLSAAAPAADACWQRLVRDWSADSSLDGRYPVSCYHDALRNMPIDLQTYSSAPTDIDAALQAEILRERERPAPAPGRASGWAFSDLAGPLLMVGGGVLALAAVLVILGAVQRRNSRLRQSLDTPGGS